MRPTVPPAGASSIGAASHVWGLSPGTALRGVSGLAVEVVDLFGQAEELAVGPEADLAAVGVEGDRGLVLVREHRDPGDLLAVVRHLVRTLLALREEDEIAGLELVLAIGVAEGRAAGEHEQPLLTPELVVVRERALAGRQVVHRQAERSSAHELADPRASDPVPRGAIGGSLGLDLVEVDVAHASPSQ